MIGSASSMVTTMPDRMSGRYFPMTFALKKVLDELLSHPFPIPRAPSVPLDLADEGARPFVGRVLEDCGAAALLHNQPMIHEHDPVGGVAVQSPSRG